ncbi:DNA translocase FtsK 4TM domain-containing protein [Bdellovibrionota bacterium]
MAISIVRQRSKQSRVREISVILLSLFAVFLTISFISYHPSDPSLNSVGTSNAAQNWGGLIGGYFADAAYQLLGLTCFLLPLICLAVVTYIVFRPQIAGHIAKAFGFLIMLLSFAALLELVIGHLIIDGQQISAGGLLGTISGGILVRYLNIGGAYLFILSSVLVSLTFTTRFSFVSLWEAIAKLVNKEKIKTVVASTGRKKWTWKGFKRKSISFNWRKAKEKEVEDEDDEEEYEEDYDDEEEGDEEELEAADVDDDEEDEYEDDEEYEEDEPEEELQASEDDEDDDMEVIELDAKPPAGASVRDEPPKKKLGFRKFLPSLGKKSKKKRRRRKRYRDLEI